MTVARSKACVWYCTCVW